MKNFDLQRFGKTFRWFFLANKKQYMYWFAGVVVALFVAQMFGTRVMFSGAEGGYEPVVRDTLSFISALSMASMLVGATQILATASGKQQLTLFLMHPSTNLEKFLAAFLYVTVGWGLVLAVAFVAGDAMRVFIDVVGGHHETVWGIPMLRGVWSFPMLNGNGEVLWEPTAFSTLFAVFFHSFFVLGGVFYRRHTLVATCVTVIAGIFLFAYVGSQGFTCHFQLMVGDMYDVRLTPWGYVSAFACFLFIVLNYWLSFRLFKRMQVVNNRWINV